MVGIWTTNLKDIYVAFDADGTYGKGFTPEAALDPDNHRWSNIDWGTWTVDDGILTFNTSEGTNFCSGDTGTYEVELTDDQVLITLIDDTCTKREIDFPSGLTRHTDTKP
jgi:hypothetical protein